MCQISRLRCQVCQHQTADEKRQPSTYRFRPCAKVKRQAVSPLPPRSTEDSDPRHDTIEDNNNDSSISHQAESVLPHGTRFHCPKLIWPLPMDKLDDFEEYVCDHCLHKGLVYHNWTVLERQFADLRRNSCRNRGGVPKVPIASEIEGSFPPSWEALVSEDVLAQITTEYIEPRKHQKPNDTTTASEPEWSARLSDGPHWNLRLWIPCCKLCRQPSLCDDDPERGFEDLEFEPNSMLWKWIARLPERTGVATTISTGFLVKPCGHCIQREMVLRVEVTNFLKNPISPRECDHAKSWAIWHWLRLRSAPYDTDFWHHELPNVAVPTYDRPDWVMYLSQMADGWYSRTGVVWEDVGELKPPFMNMKRDKGSRKVAVSMMGHYDTSLVELGQWDELVKLVNPFETAEPPTLSTKHLRLLGGTEEVGGKLAQAQAVSTGEVAATTKKTSREKKRVKLMTVPEAMEELEFMKTAPKELPKGYKAKMRSARKRAKRFATFEGIYIDADTGKAVVVNGRESVPEKDDEAPAVTPAKRISSVLKDKPKTKRVRLLEDDGIHGTESPVQSAQVMAERYQTPDTPHPSWPLPASLNEVPEDGALIRCHCRYEHHPMGALFARESYKLPFGLEEEDDQEKDAAEAGKRDHSNDQQQ